MTTITKPTMNCSAVLNSCFAPSSFGAIHSSTVPCTSISTSVIASPTTSVIAVTTRIRLMMIWTSITPATRITAMKPTGIRSRVNQSVSKWGVTPAASSPATENAIPESPARVVSKISRERFSASAVVARRAAMLSSTTGSRQKTTLHESLVAIVPAAVIAVLTVAAAADVAGLVLPVMRGADETQRLSQRIVRPQRRARDRLGHRVERVEGEERQQIGGEPRRQHQRFGQEAVE